MLLLETKKNEQQTMQRTKRYILLCLSKCLYQIQSVFCYSLSVFKFLPLDFIAGLNFIIGFCLQQMQGNSYTCDLGKDMVYADLGGLVSRVTLCEDLGNGSVSRGYQVSDVPVTFALQQ